MYSNGGGLGLVDRKQTKGHGWSEENTDRDIQLFKNGKRFVGCICPKCDCYHNIYMLWTGRGTPRKYCCNCKPLVAGYDEAAVYEASVSAPGHSKKRGPRHDGE